MVREIGDEGGEGDEEGVYCRNGLILGLGLSLILDLGIVLVVLDVCESTPNIEDNVAIPAKRQMKIIIILRIDIYIIIFVRIIKE
jgi:hypothetical protein